MTLQQLFDSIAADPALVIFYFSIIPITALLANLANGEESAQSPWSYLYSTLIYLVCIPGIFAVTLCAYTFLFERQSFLNVNAIVYFLPIFSMLATLLIIRRKVDLDRIPGFDKLSGLLLMIAATFIVMLIIEKTRIIVFFYGSVASLGVLFLIIFGVFMFGWHKLMGGKPKRRSKAEDWS